MKRRNILPMIYPGFKREKVTNVVPRMNAKLKGIIKLEAEVELRKKQVAALQRAYAHSFVVDITASNLRLLQDNLETVARFRGNTD